MSEATKLAEYLGFEVVYLDGFAYIQEEGTNGPEIKRDATLEERTLWTELEHVSAELEQRNRDLYEDVQRFKEHALSEKDARMALERELSEVRKDAERYRWLAWTSDTQPTVIYEIGTGQIMFGNKANDTIDAAMKGTP